MKNFYKFLSIIALAAAAIGIAGSIATARINNPVSIITTPVTTYAAGTAYSLTATPAALDFGTTDPSLTIASPGTYMILSRVRTDYTGATFAAVRTVSYKLRRTNNTAADLTNGSVSFLTDILTAITSTAQTTTISPVIYTTTNSDDAITIFGSVNVLPTAGTIDASEASIVAVRLY